MRLLRPGFSLVEMLVVIAIASILIIAVTVLIGRFFTISRFQFEQTRTTEDARIQLERLTDTLRNARNLDCDGSGTPDRPEEWWLQAADEGHMTFYSTVDGDTDPERVTYERVGSELRRTVEQSTATPCVFTLDSPIVVASSLHNVAAQPLFEYVGTDGSTLNLPILLDSVLRVRVQLIIDSDERTLDDAAVILTEVTPRLGQKLAAVPPLFPTPVPPTPVPPVQNALVFVTSTSYGADFGGIADADLICQQRAQTASLPNQSSFVAILSDSTTSAKDRFNVSGQIRLKNGTVVADNQADLWDGSIQNPINISETGSPVTASNVWTGTNPDGTKSTSPYTNFCQDWTTRNPPTGPWGVVFGLTYRTTAQWVIAQLLNASSSACSQLGALYCIGAGISQPTPEPSTSISPTPETCQPIICPDGRTFPTCGPGGIPINYFTNPCTTPVLPTPSNFRLFVNGSAEKPAPELSGTGPVMLDLGERWTVSFIYDDGTGSPVSIDPADPDLTVTSQNQSIVTSSQPPQAAGTLFGLSEGTSQVIASYRGETLPFSVLVQRGCGSHFNGVWIPTPSTPTTLANVCAAASFPLPEPLCGRTCSNVPQPGSDSHFSSPSSHPPVQACSPFGGGVPKFSEIFCGNLY